MDPDHLGPVAIVTLALFGLVVGAFVGLTSVGSGSLIILSMAFLLRMPASHIVGTNIALALIMVVPGSLVHVLGGTSEPATLLLLLIGAIPGTIVGSRATVLLPDRALRTAIAGLVAVSAIATIVRAY